jgi:hypothetical protein
MIPNIHHATRPERRVQADDTKKSSKHVRPQKDTLVDFIQATQHSLRKYKKNEGVLFCFLFFEIFEGEPCVDVTCFCFLFYITFLTREKGMIPLLPPTPPSLFTAFVLLGGTPTSMKGRREGRRTDGSFLCWPLFTLRSLFSISLVVLLLIGHDALDIFCSVLLFKI